MCRILKLILLGLFLNISCIQSQTNSVSEKFRELSRPEKCWVFKHPFVAKKTWLITQKVIAVCDSIANVNTLDRDKNGGQVDAFRHAYWMATLAQQIGWRKALKLGRAHEKANYIDYKKHRLEDGAHPDKASGDMDLYNNKIGIKIGKENKNISEVELQVLVIDAIIGGQMKIIKKDSLGNFLDEKNNIIPTDSLKGKWDNGKCLVSSKT
ncbi:MAG TPA: hypothetical protein PKZ43_10015 [Bacteroidales bacterium]|nr:hypothetical protein [Bacteroidales bacterium]